MSKLKKIDKEFQLTDDSVNCYGFRLLTSGYDMAEFQRSPIGYYMHDRNTGIMLRWEDFRTDGDKVFAKPVINMSHPRGQQTVDEIENGFLNAASMGHIVALEYSEDPEMMLPGQTGPTVTKWYNRECSLVDIPGNPNSFSLFDADDNPINLADFTKTTHQPMSKVLVLTAVTLAALKLPAEATQEQADKALADLVADNARLTGEAAAAKTAKDQAEQALADLKKETAEKEVKAILAEGLSAKKLTVELSAKLEKQYAGKPAELKELVDALPAYQSITAALKTDDLPAEYQGKTYRQLLAEGKLESLKAKYPQHYEALAKNKAA